MSCEKHLLDDFYIGLRRKQLLYVQGFPDPGGALLESYLLLECLRLVKPFEASEVLAYQSTDATQLELRALSNHLNQSLQVCLVDLC